MSQRHVHNIQDVRYGLIRYPTGLVDIHGSLQGQSLACSELQRLEAQNRDWESYLPLDGTTEDRPGRFLESHAKRERTSPRPAQTCTAH